MKTLTLLRHAKSGWDDAVARDFDRPLNPKGERAARAMGAHLRGLGLHFDHVVASPALRVVETLAHFEAGLGETLAPEWDRRLYLASAATLLDAVREQAGAHDHVLLVGHNPGIEDLVLMLVPDRAGDALRREVEDKYPTATVAVLTFDVGDWSGVKGDGGAFTRLVRPRDIDASLGPDDD